MSLRGVPGGRSAFLLSVGPPCLAFWPRFDDEGGRGEAITGWAVLGSLASGGDCRQHRMEVACPAQILCAVLGKDSRFSKRGSRGIGDLYALILRYVDVIRDETSE